MASLVGILMLLLDIVWYFVLAHVIINWLVNFNVLNIRQPIVYQIWSGLNRLFEPIYAPIRRMIPNVGGIDLSPMVLIFGIIAIRIIVINNLAPLAY